MVKAGKHLNIMSWVILAYLIEKKCKETVKVERKREVKERCTISFLLKSNKNFNQ